jgi:hypothetical protein
MRLLVAVGSDWRCLLAAMLIVRLRPWKYIDMWFMCDFSFPVTRSLSPAWTSGILVVPSLEFELMPQGFACLG